MLHEFLTTVKKPRNLWWILVSAVVVAAVMLLVPQLEVISGLTRYFGITDPRLWKSLISTLLNSFIVQSSIEKLVFVVFTLTFGLNTVLFVRYLRTYRNLLKSVGASLSLVGVVLGVLGTGCLSCGALLLAPLATIFGVSFASWFVGHGLIVSLVGFAFVMYSVISLLKKLSQPQVCESVLPKDIVPN